MPSSPKSPPLPPHFTPDDPRKGLFRNGEWYCKYDIQVLIVKEEKKHLDCQTDAITDPLCLGNCEPRKKAVIRPTKKGENWGKRFWACPKGQEENRCKMFLWVDESERLRDEFRKKHGYIEKKQATLPEAYTPRKVRDQPGNMPPAQENADQNAAGDDASTASSTSSESSSDTTSSEEEEEDEEPAPAPTPSRTTGRSLQSSAMSRTAGTGATSSKKKRPSQDDEDFLEDLSEGGVEELVAAEERSVKKLGKQREMPMPMPATPTTTAPRTTDIEHGMPTPSLTIGRSSVKKLQYNIPSPQTGESSRAGGATSPKRQRLNDSHTEGEGSRLFGTDKTINPPSSPSPVGVGDPESLTKEVMDLLKEKDIDFATRNAVRHALKKHEKLAKGLECGRDASRKAAKEAEEQRARLQMRIDELEQARREVKTQLMDMWEHI
ncbi:hypothetical protein F5Y07DRAFT_256054 [Xylaria sp. FL0933]|nr:hypothetical protein F5Y07DRAFT_256054 [Xylaria sp. FL0933]